MEKVEGKISKFGQKGYGFIDGNDGKKYFVHKKNINSNITPKIGAKVIFNVEKTDKGLVAMNINFKSKLKSNNTNILFGISFMLHLVILYKLFFYE